MKLRHAIILGHFFWSIVFAAFDNGDWGFFASFSVRFLLGYLLLLTAIELAQASHALFSLLFNRDSD